MQMKTRVQHLDIYANNLWIWPSSSQTTSSS